MGQTLLQALGVLQGRKKTQENPVLVECASQWQRGEVSSWEDLMLMNPAETNMQGWQGHGRNLRLSREVREGLTEKLMLEGVREQAVHTSHGTASQAEGTACANTVGMFRKLPHVAGGQEARKE